MKDLRSTLKIIIIPLIILTLILITFLTNYYGHTDLGDYSDTAKFFSGDYAANMRNSHTYLYGALVFPFVGLFKNFEIFKFISLGCIFLIIYILYIRTGMNKKSLILFLLCPIFWYMAPWITPLQIVSLLFLLGFLFIDKYNQTKNFKNLLFSGILLGLAAAFWTAVFLFIVPLAIIFLYDKKTIHSVGFIFALLIGLLPLFVLDQILFNFPFFTLLKTVFAYIISFFWDGIYGIGIHNLSFLLWSSFTVIAFIPLVFWFRLKKEFFKGNKRLMSFILVSILVILLNPQIRYDLILAPIALLLFSKQVTDKQFKIQVIISILLIFLLVFPITLSFKSDTSINDNLEKIVKEYPDQMFIVGNTPDDYQTLANIYWGHEVKEFVSIQDYELWLNNQTTIFEKKIMPQPNINDRRTIWIAGGLSANAASFRDYDKIVYAISINEPLNMEGVNFSLLGNYGPLYLYNRSV